MPRAQGGFLSGAVWPITAIFACCLLVSFTNALHHLELHRSNAPDVTDQSSALEALFNTEWSDEDLQMLQKMMDEQVERFRSQLFEQHKAQLHREKRSKATSQSLLCLLLSLCVTLFSSKMRSNLACAIGDGRNTLTKQPT